jgi:hypothetical protein
MILAVLSIFTAGGDPFFDRSYSPERPECHKLAADIKISDGFFNNLPTKPTKAEKKSHKPPVLLKTKAQRDEARLSYFIARYNLLILNSKGKIK